MKNVEKIEPTGLFTNYIFKAIPLAFDESLSYYECLCGLLSYLKETVIPTVNNNANAIIEVQNLMTQLQNYVNNYFTNLDVQNEINNKLDDMIKDGSLQKIVDNYFNEVTKMINDQNDKITNLSNITQTNTNQIATIISENNPTEGNSELIDLRVGLNGNVYLSAGESVRNQILNLYTNDKINRNVLNSGIFKEKIDLSNFFEKGGISTETGIIFDSEYSIRSKIFLQFDELAYAMEINNTSLFLEYMSILIYNNDETYRTHVTYKKDLQKNIFDGISKNAKYKIIFVYSTEHQVNLNTDIKLINTEFTFTYNRKNQVYDIEVLNLINPDYMIKNLIISDENGLPSYKENYEDWCSGVFKVEPNTKYYLDKPGFYLSFLDETGKLIEFHGGETQLTNPITTPENCYYIGISNKYENLNKSAFLSKENKYYEYGDIALTLKNNVKSLPYYQNPLTDKTIACFGDSITSTDYTMPNWCDIIKSNTNCNILNYGISGTTLSHTNDRHLWDYHFTKLDAETIGYDPSNPKTWSTGNCFCERFTKINPNSDGIVIMGGTNDNNVPLGEWNSEDTSTFYGGLNTLLKGISKNLNGKKIIICTPIQKSNDYTLNVIDALSELKNTPSTSFISLQLRAEAIKQKCKEYGIPCLDLYNSSGINGIDDNKIYYRTDDTLHPSEIGQIRLASLIQSELEKIFS